MGETRIRTESAPAQAAVAGNWRQSVAKLVVGVYRQVAAVFAAFGLAAIVSHIWPIGWNGWLKSLVGVWVYTVRPVTAWVFHYIVTVPMEWVNVHVVVPLPVRDYVSVGIILALSYARTASLFPGAKNAGTVDGALLKAFSSIRSGPRGVGLVRRARHALLVAPRGPVRLIPRDWRVRIVGFVNQRAVRRAAPLTPTPERPETALSEDAIVRNRFVLWPAWQVATYVIAAWPVALTHMLVVLVVRSRRSSQWMEENRTLLRYGTGYDDDFTSQFTFDLSDDTFDAKEARVADALAALSAKASLALLYTLSPIIYLALIVSLNEWVIS